MSYRLSAQIIGKEEMDRIFRQSPALTIRELSRGLSHAASGVQGKAKRHAPVDQGVLRASIHTEGPHARGDDVEAIVGTNVKYARMQEEGTGLYGPKKRLIVPIKGKLLVFKKGGETIFARSVKGVRPKWYFKRAMEESRGPFADEMRDAVRRIVHALAA